MLKDKLNLTEQGYRNLKRSIIACTLENLCLFLPFAVLFQIIVTFLTPLLVDAPLDINKLGILLALGVFVALIFFFTYRWEYRQTYTAAYRESMSIRIDIAERMRKLPLSFFSQRNLSDLTTNLMANCATVEHAMSHVVPQIIGYTLSSSLACLMLSFYDWRMSLAIFCVLPFAFFIIFIGKKVEDHLSRQHNEAKLTVSDQVQEYLEGIKIIKAFGLSEQKFEQLETCMKNMMNIAIKSEFVTGIFVTGATLLLQTGIGLVVLIGVTFVLDGSLNLFAFLTFILISTRIYSPIIAIMSLLPGLFHLLVSLENMQKLRKTAPMLGSNEINLTKFDINFNNVSFGYNENDVIKNMSLNIPSNQVTAFVGPSGSGKTTLVRLIARFWDVKSGEITIDNHNIRDIDPDKLMSYLSFVFQDVILFNDTVLNNIRMGKQNATDQEVYDAARRARCDEFIQRLPQGYETVLSENGSSLSGGERQRISIARALLKNTPIILLDEATASLDPQNEIFIQEAIAELLNGRSVIMIAHRLKTIVNANQIIVINNGEIAEKGDFKSLINQKGLFHRLFTLQQQNLEWNVD